MEYERYLVYGLGISGIGAVEYLSKQSKQVFVYDDNIKLGEELKRGCIVPQNTVIIHKINSKILKNIECIVLSPGIKMPNKIDKLVKKMGISVIGELELASKNCPCSILAITGTNGKTTTTMLLSDMLSAGKKDVHTVGNIGTSFCSELSVLTLDSVAVCEVSSFQLENCSSFAPVGIGFLNFSADHLDRYSSINDYLSAKTNIFNNINENTVIALNYDDDTVRELGKGLVGQVYYFSTSEVLPSNYKGAHVVGEHMYLDSSTDISIKNCTLKGKQNLYDVMCASILAFHFGISASDIEKVLAHFVPPRHRLEYVGTVRGVSYINDSKATNTHASLAALDSINSPIILLLGGSDKGEDFKNYFANIPNKVKAIVTFGETGKKLYKIAKSMGLNVYVEYTLEDAYIRASGLAVEGDTVLLSPACASFDEFLNFEERGNFFCYLINGG